MVAERSDEDGPAGSVPPAVRALLVDAAADVLGTLDPLLVPAALQRVKAFAPRRRASAGAAPLWRALVDDAGFRHAVGAAWSREHATAAGASPDPSVPAGQGLPDDRTAAPRDKSVTEPGAEEPATPALVREHAAGAFLLRPDGWEAVVERARALDATLRTERSERGEVARLRRERDRLAEQVEELRAQVSDAVARADAATAELAGARRAERRLRADADRARAEARAVLEAASAERAEAEGVLRDAREERRAAGVELARARAERDEARRARTSATDVATARARLLLDTVVDAATGLRRELALGPATTTPADDVAAALPAAVARPRPGSRGRAADDPALLGDLLSVPRTHLVVDGYNVTKTGFGDLTLAEQRDRLLNGLLRVAAGGTEVTVCFDGADVAARPVHAPRGVRVLFSSGEIADDLIRRLVAAEPAGRPVVVVTSDRAVSDDVQAMGAVCVPAQALLARLARR
ncbi:NYN domain-containing protein [Cellulosimicrobium cellulans]|uniref:NYN domain-containing protein n=1 Tax=Cellulosimicrobium cellulans TaxID=1710 RepID=UPI00196584D8|nr:NYN domain-containing protein [Cellulosimicrobium cellulans]MBN0039568.1 NYN domain-containing protein [Cellulosimicrobium cellulans]